MSTVIWFQCFFVVVEVGLCALLASEVMSTARQGKSWRTPFIGGFALVVVMTIILQWVIWDLMMNPLSLALPAVYCAAFVVWSASITWWIFIVLKEASTRPVEASRKEVQGESEVALQAALHSISIEKMMFSGGNAVIEATQEGNNEQ